MTGPEHYRLAEALLTSCQLSSDLPEDVEYYPAKEDGVDTCANALAAAQVHATLALAAATALGSQRVDDHGMAPADDNAWLAVASVQDVAV
ncbi:MAG TPA: hypothetical protein VGX25_13445 [Actinophytocola sp.]|uniref:hypothetical protein n=1 Tax=Actinophytocola sp. TaxID=1872138 RepID=UPI002DDC9F3D|nr:hypothetical protein [Actinophytocola sp.]HEV2780388.1 hypothetical protein [Actinophytocola sp.]